MDGREAEPCCIRRAWTDLVARRLPQAAQCRGWPVSSPASFERLLLDHVHEAPWESVVRGPATAADPIDLLLALELGEKLLSGEADPAILNRRSLALRAVRLDDRNLASPLSAAPPGEGTGADARHEAARLNAADLGLPTGARRIRRRGGIRS